MFHSSTKDSRCKFVLFLDIYFYNPDEHLQKQEYGRFKTQTLIDLHLDNLLQELCIHTQSVSHMHLHPRDIPSYTCILQPGAVYRFLQT